MLDPRSKVRYKRPGKGPPWKRKKKQYEVVKLYNPGDPPECGYCRDRVEKLWKKGTISVPLHKGCTCQLTKPYWVSKAVYEGKKGPPTKKFGGEMKADTFASIRNFALSYYLQGMIKEVILDEVRGTLPYIGDDVMERLAAEIDKWDLYGPPEAGMKAQVKREAQIMTIGDEFLDKKTGEIYVLESTQPIMVGGTEYTKATLRNKATSSMRTISLAALAAGVRAGTWEHLSASPGFPLHPPTTSAARRSVVGQEEAGLETVEAPEPAERKCAECGKPMNPVEWMLSPGICGECVRKKHREVTGQEEYAVGEWSLEKDPTDMEVVKMFERAKEILEDPETDETVRAELEPWLEKLRAEINRRGLSVIGQVEVIPSTEEKIEEDKEKLEQQLEEVQEALEEKGEAVEEAAGEAEDEAGKGAVEEAEVALEVAEETVEEAVEAVEAVEEAETRTEVEQAEEVVEEAEEAVQEVTAQEATKWRLYHAFDCDSEMGFNNGSYLPGEYDNEDEARQAAQQHLSPHTGEWVGTDPDAYQVTTGYYDGKIGVEISEEEYDSDNPDHGYRYEYVSVESIYEQVTVREGKVAQMEFQTGEDYPHVCQACKDAVDRAAGFLKNYGPDTDDPEAPMMYAADRGWLCGGRECVNEPVTAQVTKEEEMKVVSDPGWKLYQGTGCSSSPTHAGCASEGDTGLRFMDLDEARLEAESLVGGGGDWLGDNEYELKTGHFDKEGNPITEQEYSAGMAQTPDPGYYYMFDFVRLEPATEPPYVAQVAQEEGAAEAAEEAVEKVKEEFKDALEDVKERVEQVVEKVVEEVEDITARRMMIGQDETVAPEVAGAVKMMRDEADRLRTALAGSDETLVDFVRQNYPYWMDEFQPFLDSPSIGVGMRGKAEHQLGILELRISELTPGTVEAAETAEEAEEALEEAEAEEEVAEEELAEAEEEVAEAETPAEEEAAEEAVEEAEEVVEEAEEAVEEAEEELEEVQAEVSLIAEMKEVDEMIAARDAKKAQVEEPTEEEYEGWLREQNMDPASLEYDLLSKGERIELMRKWLAEVKGLSTDKAEEIISLWWSPEWAGKAQSEVAREAQEETLSDEALLAKIKEVIAELGGDLTDEERKPLLARLYDELVPEAKSRGLEVWRAKEAQHGDLGGLSDERLAELVGEYTEAKEELETLALTPGEFDPRLQELIGTYEQQLGELAEEMEKRKGVETPFQATRRIAALDTGAKSEEAAKIIAAEYRRRMEADKKVKPLRPGRPTRIRRAGARDDRLTE